MTIYDIRLANAQAGFYFFEDGALRFFTSRISNDVQEGPGGIYFTTSEQFRPLGGTPHKRKYTVRQFDPATGKVHDVGGFQQYRDEGSARRAAIRAAKGST